MIRGGSVELSAPDVDAAVRFYVETLGMKLLAASSDRSAIIDAGGGFLLRLERREGSPGAPPLTATITLYTKVPLSQAIAIYENRGVRFDAGGSFRDPAGNAIVLADQPAYLADGS